MDGLFIGTYRKIIKSKGDNPTDFEINEELLSNPPVSFPQEIPLRFKVTVKNIKNDKVKIYEVINYSLSCDEFEKDITSGFFK